MGRKQLGEREKILTLIAQIIAERGNDILQANGRPSPKKLCDILNSEYAIEVTQNTMIVYLKEDLTKFTQIDLDNNKSIILQQLNESINEYIKIRDTATNPNIKIRAGRAADAAQVIRAKVLKILAEANVSHENSIRPVYHITFGEPTKVNKKPDEKEPFFKAGDGQATIDEAMKKKEGEEDNTES